MSYCVVLNVFSINFYEVAVSVDFVWNQGRIVRNDYEFASSCEVSVCVVEFVEGISFCIHFASDSFVVSCAEVEVHCFAFVHFNGEECFISKVKYCDAVAFFYFPETWFGSIVCPIEGNFTNVCVSIFTGNPNFVCFLGVGFVVSYVYVVLVRMPFHMAIFDADAAEKVMEQFPDIQHWYMAGHSMGGAMASKFASDHPDEVEGLILMGAYLYGDYPEEKTLTIYGSLNQSVEDHIDYTQNIVEIQGGNHAQFGNYGAQKGDLPAEISTQEQQAQAVAAIEAFLSEP